MELSNLVVHATTVKFKDMWRAALPGSDPWPVFTETNYWGLEYPHGYQTINPPDPILPGPRR